MFIEASGSFSTCQSTFETTELGTQSLYFSISHSSFYAESDKLIYIDLSLPYPILVDKTVVVFVSTTLQLSACTF